MSHVGSSRVVGRSDFTQVDIQPLLDEVPSSTEGLDGCCGCVDYDKVCQRLQNEGWLTRMNTALGKHGLVAQLHFFWSYNVGSTGDLLAF